MLSNSSLDVKTYGGLQPTRSIWSRSRSLIFSIRLQRTTSRFPDTLFCNPVRLVARQAHKHYQNLLMLNVMYRAFLLHSFYNYQFCLLKSCTAFSNFSFVTLQIPLRSFNPFLKAS